MRNRFGKRDKLKSRKTIEKLFSDGESVKAFPLIAVYSDMPNNQVDHKIGFSVSKRKFKKAVDRNRIKRKLREAYRLNKGLIANGIINGQAIMFIYIASNDFDMLTLEAKMVKLLELLKAKKSGQS